MKINPFFLGLGAPLVLIAASLALPFVTALSPVIAVIGSFGGIAIMGMSAPLGAIMATNGDSFDIHLPKLFARRPVEKSSTESFMADQQRFSPDKEFSLRDNNHLGKIFNRKDTAATPQPAFAANYRNNLAMR